MPAYLNIWNNSRLAATLRLDSSQQTEHDINYNVSLDRLTKAITQHQPRQNASTQARLTGQADQPKGV